LKSDKNLHGVCTQQLQVCTELQAHIFTSDLSPYACSWLIFSLCKVFQKFNKTALALLPLAELSHSAATLLKLRTRGNKLRTHSD